MVRQTLCLDDDRPARAGLSDAILTAGDADAC